MNAIGLDIGTTTICAAVADVHTGELLESVTAPNNCEINGASFERCQNPQTILEICISALDKLIEKHSPVCSIGITGQMHGVIYLDSLGTPLSPLYTWQDASADEECESGTTYAEKLSKITGYKMASGFGCSTYFVHAQKGCVPEGTAKICTVHDYVAMKLTGRNAPVMHTSDAASFGLFDTDKLCFDAKAIICAGLDCSVLPEIAEDARILGKYKEIPVCIAIGDNQASFIGSVRDTDSSVLVNIGTGSQMSFMTQNTAEVALTELRPCHEKSFIRVGSALCGGRAFAALEAFIRQTANLCGGNVENAYSFIDEYLNTNQPPVNQLDVSTAFVGTRESPTLRGHVKNIGLDNFTPGHLIYGILDAISGELYNMYSPCPDKAHSCVVGSGNGLRKNTALQRIISEMFGMPLMIPAHKEEAAYGAMLYSLTACGIYPDLKAAQALIKYL